MAAAAAAAAEGAEPSTALEGVGPITLVQGKDTSNFVQGQLDKWNQQHPDQKVTLIELPEDADAQRQQMIQNANAKSDAYAVLARRQRLDRRVRGQPLHRRSCPQTSSPTRRVPAAGDRLGEVQGQALRRPLRLRRRHAVLPHRPAAGRGHRRAAEDVAGDDRRLQEDPGDAAGRGRQLLRRSVPEVRGPHRERRRGHQQRGRRDHRRRGQARTSTPRRRRRASTSWPTASSRATSPRKPSPTRRRSRAAPSRRAS